MIIYIIAVLILLRGIERLTNSGREVRLEECRYRLFALRDKLRGLAIDGELESGSWLFGYLDSSIAKTIRVLPRFSLWRMIAMFLAYRNNPSVSEARRHLAQSLSRPENRKFAEIHAEYISLMVTFLIRRHLTSVGVSLLAFSVFLGIKKVLRNMTEVATESPEASTLTDYCPQSA